MAYCKHGHELTAQTVYRRKDGRSYCKTCSKASAKKYSSRKQFPGTDEIDLTLEQRREQYKAGILRAYNLGLLDKLEAQRLCARVDNLT